MNPQSWLERDDRESAAQKRLWRDRVMQAAGRRAAERMQDQPDWPLAIRIAAFMQYLRAFPPSSTDNPECARLTAAREQSIEDARERPWLRVKPVYPVSGMTSEDAVVGLLASLQFDPPTK